MLMSQKMSFGVQKYTEEDKLEFLKNLRQWHYKFNYKLFNLEELNTTFLADNEKYLTIKDRLQNFNKLLKQSEKTKTFLPDLPQRYTFYSQIMQLMRETLLIQSKEVQSDYLDRIYNWFITEQAIYDPKSEIVPPQVKVQKVDEKQSTSNLDYTQAPTMDETRQQIDLEESQMPSYKMQEVLKDYKCKARTTHKFVDPPLERLTNYKRRQYNSLIQTADQKITPPSSVFPKNVIIPKQLQSKITEEQGSLQDITPPEISVAESEQEKEKQKQPQSMIPNVKVFVEEREQKDQEKQQQADIEQKANYQNYKPTTNDIELALQQRWNKNRQREVAANREDQEMISQLKVWSKYRGRIEKEIDRRVESTNYGSRYTQCDFREQPSYSEHDSKMVYLTQLPVIVPGQHKSTHLDISNLEQKIAQQKINKAKNAYRNLLNMSSGNADQINNIDEDINSLSIYAKQRSNSVHNKFSSLLQKNSPQRINESQLAEIMEIKHRMAKYKIAVPINKLMAGIMIPNCESNENDKLPEPGQMILPNPFEVKKGAKKGKKKRRG